MKIIFMNWDTGRHKETVSVMSTDSPCKNDNV